MIRHFLISAPAIIALTFSGFTQAQTSQTTPARVLGDVSAINAANNQVTLKTSEGRLVNVLIDARTLYRRVAPGETTLEHASVISFADIAVGDRVLARGEVGEKDSVRANALIVIAKTDIAQKRAQDREEWTRRGIAGRITGLNPDTKEITLARTQEGGSPRVIQAAGNVRFRRYSQDSVRFRDSTESSFAELKVGDQLRALGNKSADGSRFTPEEIISGSFRSVGGIITEVKAESKEVVVKDPNSAQPVTLKLNDDSMMRRLSPDLVKVLAQRIAANSVASNSQTSAEGADIQSAIEKLSPISISDLKPGEAMLATSTQGVDPSHVTAVVVVMGVDSLFKTQGAQPQRSLNLVLGLPTGVGP